MTGLPYRLPAMVPGIPGIDYNCIIDFCTIVSEILGLSVDPTPPPPSPLPHVHPPPHPLGPPQSPLGLCFDVLYLGVWQELCYSMPVRWQAKSGDVMLARAALRRKAPSQAEKQEQKQLDNPPVGGGGGIG